MQCRLIFRRIEQRLNRFDDLGIEDAPNADGLAIVLMAESIQEAIHRLRLRLKSSESFAINPSQVSVFHSIFSSTL